MTLEATQTHAMWCCPLMTLPTTQPQEMHHNIWNVTHAPIILEKVYISINLLWANALSGFTFENDWQTKQPYLEGTEIQNTPGTTGFQQDLLKLAQQVTPQITFGRFTRFKVESTVPQDRTYSIW